MIQRIQPSLVVYTRSKKQVHKWCTQRYRGHPRGCPNFNDTEGHPNCPPHQPIIDEVLDFESPLYMVYTTFCLGEVAERIKKAHPDWTPRQWYNIRYWQGTARKLQREEEARAVSELGLTKIIDSPEAHGVNLDATMENLGIELDWNWPPEHSLENLTYRISMGGYAKP